MDLPEAAGHLQRLREEIGEGREVFPISAATGEGVQELIFRASRLLDELPAEVSELPDPEERIVKYQPAERFTITRENDTYIVSGAEIERHVAMTKLDNEEAVQRLQRIMALMGLEQALKEAGAREGNTIRIGKLEFDYVD